MMAVIGRLSAATGIGVFRESKKTMSIGGLSARGVSFIFAAILTLYSAFGWTCASNDVAQCMYADGKFAPFEIEFTTETSAGGLNVDVGISQRLEKGVFDDQWKFRTKITGFLYGLYGSVTRSETGNVGNIKSCVDGCVGGDGGQIDISLQASVCITYGEVVSACFKV